MITVYELLHHTTATKYTIYIKGTPIALTADTFTEKMPEIGGCPVWQFSALDKDGLEIIAKPA